MELSPGTKLGPYEILSRLGEGGMGEVWKARDTRLDRIVAIKTSQAKFSERFEREARAVAALNHPHICTLYDVGPDYLVMEYIEGKPPGAPLPIDEAVRYAAHIADALDAAHAKGVIHRDIKPANVMITARAEAKVLDFGLAQLDERNGDGESATKLMLTAAGAAVGTVAYMSPEQARGQAVDGRTDIWALGVMLYEMATGARPFQGATQASVFDAILNRAAVAPSLLNADVPPSLEHVILKATEKDRALRYQTAGDLLADLKRIQRDAIAASAPTAAMKTPSAVPAVSAASTPPSKPTRLRPRYLAAGAVALAALAAGLFFAFRPAAKPTAERSEWQQLTNFTDSVTDPALSADGRMLAFKRGGWFMSHGQIYVKMLPNGQAVQLTHDDLSKMVPVFSPDGSRVVYTTAGWDTWEVPVLAGGEPRRMLANAEGLQWIDPRHILFSEVRPSPNMVVVVSEESRAGKRDVYVPPNPIGMAHFSALSPDRKQVLIVEMEAGWLPCRLVPFDGSSKGKQVGPAPARCTAAAWSPDGTSMYFTADTGGGSHIWRQKTDGTPPMQFTSGPTTEQGIAVSPDGRSIISSVGTHRSAVWVHDAKGDRQISLEGDAGWAHFSPDGSKVFYLVSQPGQPGQQAELWDADLNSGRAGPALPGVRMTSLYQISSDGKSLAYVAGQSSKATGGLWFVPLDQRTPPRNLVAGGVLEVSGIGPSGDIFYVTQDAQGIHGRRIAADGTGSRELGQTQERAPGGSVISPDEQWVFDGSNAFPLNGDPPVAACPACFFVWSPDGKSVAITLRALAGAEGVTGIVPLGGNSMLPPLPPEGIRSAADLKKIPGAQVVPYEGASPGPAGSYAYTKTETLSNLYRIPLP